MVKGSAFGEQYKPETKSRRHRQWRGSNLLLIIISAPFCKAAATERWQAPPHHMCGMAMVAKIHILFPVELSVFFLVILLQAARCAKECLFQIGLFWLTK